MSSNDQQRRDGAGPGKTNDSGLGCIGFRPHLAEDALDKEIRVSLAVSQLCRQLLSSPSLEDIASSVLQHAKRLTLSAAGFVENTDPDTPPSADCEKFMDGMGVPSAERRRLARLIECEGPQIVNEPFPECGSNRHDPERPTLRRFLSVPARAGGMVVGRIVVANAERDYAEPDAEIVGRIAEVYAAAVERHRAYSQLYESRRRLATLMANLPGMAYRCANDANRTPEFVSEGCLELTGYSFRELLADDGKVFAGLVHPDDRDATRRQVQEAVRDHRRYQITYRMITAGGEEKWVWEQGCGVYSQNGTLLALEGFVSDVTARKLAEEALRDSESRYRQIVETAMEGIWLTDENERTEFVNRRMAQMLGCSVDDMIGRFSWDFVHPSEAGRLADIVDRRRLGSTEEYDLRLQRADGCDLWAIVSANPVFDKEGRYAGALAMVTDITQRKLAEEDLTHANDELLRVNEELERILERNVDGMVIVDSEGQVCYANPAAAELLGKPVAQLVGKRLDFPVEPKGALEVEIKVDGRPNRVAEVRAAAMSLLGMQVVLASLRDITESKEMAARLAESQREQLQIKDRFLSHISHELRSPLAAVYEFATIIRDGLAGAITEEQREYLEIIVRNVKHLRTMINDLLDLTRAGAGKLVLKPSLFSLGELIAETAGAFGAAAAAKGLKLSVTSAEGMPSTLADSARVRQVLANLIDNAFKFTPPGGSVTIDAGPDADPAFLRVTVSDTGCGIQPENIERIFDRLFQEQAAGSPDGNHKGLGLGLCICRELVNSQGGRIWAESTLGKGSTFVFTVPVAAAPLSSS